MASERRVQDVSQAAIDAFYRSRDWTRLSYRAKVKHGRKCQCCGANSHDGAKIISDHIKPLRYFWGLRLDLNNIQVLCEPCNLGKGSWDDTDHRPQSIGQVLFDCGSSEEKRRLKRALVTQYSNGLIDAEQLTAAIRTHELKHA